MGFVRLSDLRDVARNGGRFSGSGGALRYRGAGLGQTSDPGAPSIMAIQPASGAPGATVVVRGTNLLATSVTFNGTPATSFSVIDPSQVNAVVAPGTTSGPVVVTTPAGSSSFSSFTVLTVPAGTLVQQAVDDVLRPLGLPSETPGVYTLDRLYAIQNAAIARGVDVVQVVPLVRQEVFRRVLQSDPTPQAGLTELALRLTGTTAYAPQAPPPPVAAPTPPAYWQSPAQPSYQATTPTPVSAASRRERRRDPPNVARGSGFPSWAPYAAAAAGGAVLVALLRK